MKDIIKSIEEQIRNIRNVKQGGNLSDKVTLSHVEAETLVKFYYDSQINNQYVENIEKIKEIMRGI